MGAEREIELLPVMHLALDKQRRSLCLCFFGSVSLLVVGLGSVVSCLHPTKSVNALSLITLQVSLDGRQ
jgi:hypothetical protein